MNVNLALEHARTVERCGEDDAAKPTGARQRFVSCANDAGEADLITPP